MQTKVINSETTARITPHITPVISNSQFTFGESKEWTVSVSKTRILNQLQVGELEEKLQVHHLPEMIFNSTIQIKNSTNGFELSFNAEDAMRHAKNDILGPLRSSYLPAVKVGYAWDKEKKRQDFEKLQSSKSNNSCGDCETKMPAAAAASSPRVASPSATTSTSSPTTTTVSPVASPRQKQQQQQQQQEQLEERDDNIDWTFTTLYKGTLVNAKSVEKTTEKINYDRLKRRDPILFFDDILLFEDELHDNGTAWVNVKMRVMNGYLFILMRFFLRVDGVIVRIIDNRFYFEFDKPYLLREFSVKQQAFSVLKQTHPIAVADAQFIADANKMEPLLALSESVTEKITF